MLGLGFRALGFEFWGKGWVSLLVGLWALSL